jgi:hypothetical protein
MPTDIEVNGVPFYLITNGDGFYVFAVAQKVNINGSPVIVSFDPPIAPTVDAGTIYQAIVAKLAG